MTGISSWDLLRPLLRPWPYRFLFFGLMCAFLLLISSKKADRNAGHLVAEKHLVIAILGSQVLAFVSTAVFVGWNLDWKMHLDPPVVENWVGIFWHFYVGDFLSEISLGLAVFGLIWAGNFTWGRIGVKRAVLPIPAIFILVAATYLILHLAIRPISMSLWEQCLRFFRPHFSQGSDGDLALWEVWLLKQTVAQLGDWGAVLIVLWLGVLAPIIEEIFFRGLLLTALWERTSTWIAIVGQSLLFAAIHIDMVRLPYLVVFGLILGYLVKRASSVLPAVFLHVFVNLISIRGVLF